jgi:hypothetical protein
MTHADRKSSSKVKLFENAKRVLEKELGKSDSLPEPYELPSLIMAVPAASGWGRLDQKRAQLRAFQKAHAWRLVINSTGRGKAYSAALRKHHGLSKSSTMIGCILRLLLPRKANLAEDRARASQRYAEWAQGVRYLYRKRILPTKVVSVGMRKGEGISAWAKRERRHRAKQPL